MLHREKGGKQGALSALSNISSLEIELQNSGGFSFWFLPDIKEKVRVTPSLETEITHLCVLVSRKLLTLGGRRLKKESQT